MPGRQVGRPQLGAVGVGQPGPIDRRRRIVHDRRFALRSISKLLPASVASGWAAIAGAASARAAITIAVPPASAPGLRNMLFMLPPDIREEGPPRARRRTPSSRSRTRTREVANPSSMVRRSDSRRSAHSRRRIAFDPLRAPTGVSSPPNGASKCSFAGSVTSRGRRARARGPGVRRIGRTRRRRSRAPAPSAPRWWRRRG